LLEDTNIRNGKSMINTWGSVVISLSTLMLTHQSCLAASEENVLLDLTPVQIDPKLLPLADKVAQEDPSSVRTDTRSLTPAEKKIQKILTEEQKQTIEFYEELVRQLESSGGVYQMQLSEILLSLGDTYQTLGQYEEAIEIYKRSLHISRVNDGLYSLNQIVMLEKMIESNNKLKDWDALNKNYHNLYWISKRHYGENSPELLTLIDRLGRWHLQAYELAPGKESFFHLINAELLYNKSAEIIEQQNGARDLRLINALYGIALTNFQIAAQVSSIENFDDIRSGFRDSNQTRRMLQEQRARQDLITQSYIKGRNAMNQIIDIHASNPILPLDTQAMAMTHLGDWYLLFNKRNSAAETYDQAYELMRNDGMEQAKIDRLFGQPRSLPAIKLPTQNRDELIPEDPFFVLASFDVSPSGKAQNIRILDSKPKDNVSYLRRAKRSIASTKFRPRYENGEPVKTTGVNLRYVFTD
jgi:tetratricopeptide (TPR) repeat protein